jgi:hypothetical protein
MLAPVVSVTHDFDPAIVSHQSIELARGWELGGWEDATFSDIISTMTNEENPDAAIFDYQTSSLLTGKGKMDKYCGILVWHSKFCAHVDCVIVNHRIATLQISRSKSREKGDNAKDSVKSQLWFQDYGSTISNGSRRP